MKREIKFRGKRLDNGAWETGSLVVKRMGLSDESVFIADKMTAYHTPVDPSTVGQFTGMTDKNGKEIYEGDIVFNEWSQEEREFLGFSVTTPFYAVVVWDEEYAGFRLKEKPHDEDWGISFIAEISGNIHDNPECLKKEKR